MSRVRRERGGEEERKREIERERERVRVGSVQMRKHVLCVYGGEMPKTEKKW